MTTIDSKTLTHVAALDGFRGGLALWVYLGHLSLAVGYSNYFLAIHALAVDLFMVLSGFLMIYTWKGSHQPTHHFLTTSVKFYLARFFRIAPLYYVLLLLCYVFLPQLNQMHDYALKLIPPPWVQDLTVYDPKSGWVFDSWRWLYLHLSFAFGVVPGMEASTPLPDWSLSLEMQFYLIFPVLLLVLGAGSWALLALAIGAAILAWFAPGLFGSYLTPGSLTHFGQPSMLAYRLNAFLAGMVLAFWLRQKRSQAPSRFVNVVTVLAIAICLLPLSKPVILIYLVFAALIFEKIPPLNWLLGRKPFKILGDMSYSIYLVHLLVVIPGVYWLLQSSIFIGLSPIAKFACAVGLTCPVVLVASYVLHQWVEQPGIRLGRYLIKKFGFSQKARPLL